MTTVLSLRNRVGDIREFAAEARADFALEGSLRESDGQFVLTAWIIHGQSGTALHSGRFAGGTAGDIVNSFTDWLREVPLGIALNGNP